VRYDWLSQTLFGSIEALGGITPGQKLALAA
jgi:hypothetical protein